MNNSEDTLETQSVLAAIAELSKEIKGLNDRLNSFEKVVEKRLDSIENQVDSLEKTVEKRFDANDVQFEIIREGISYNSAKFDRLEAKIFDARSDILNFRADIKELTEQIRRQEKAINGKTLTLEK